MGPSSRVARGLAGLVVASVLSLVLLVDRRSAQVFDAGHIASVRGPERAALPGTPTSLVASVLGKATSAALAAIPALPATIGGTQPGTTAGLAAQSGAGGAAGGGGGPAHTSMTLLQWLAHTDPFPPLSASDIAAFPRPQRRFAAATNHGGGHLGIPAAPPPRAAQRVTRHFDPSSTLVRYTDRGTCGPRGDDAQADFTQCALGYTTVEEVPNQDYEVQASVDGCDYFSWTVYGNLDIILDFGRLLLNCSPSMALTPLTPLTPSDAIHLVPSVSALMGCWWVLAILMACPKLCL